MARDVEPGQWRESAGRLATRAYEAAYGREISDESRGVRWHIEPRVAVTAVVVLVMVTGLVWLGSGRMAEGDSGQVEHLAASVTPSVAAPAPAVILVHVTGEVERPGVIELDDGARVNDAIEAAGGVTSGADLTAVNLARTAHDGEQIHVPGADESLEAGAPASPSGAGLVSINRADAVALESLPGIGPVLAQRIVANRDSEGPFSSVSDLARVPGVGPAIVGSLEGLATP